MIPPERTPIVTVFGASGFIGRYVSEALLKAGARLRVAERDPRRAYFLQPLGTVGQVEFCPADMARPSTFARAVEGASAVINLVGAFNGNLQQVHADGPRDLARAARKAGVSAFVHVSAIGADAKSPSDYARTKGEGEAAVREAFPKSTILRPSVVFGAEDDFTNRFARLAELPLVPLVAARTRFQPVYVRDLAGAIAEAALQPKAFGGKTLDVAGPETLSLRGLFEQIASITGRHPDVVELPKLAGSVLAAFGWLPGAPLTRDQWLLLQRDNVATSDGLKAFGISPTALGAVAGDWLGRYQRGGRFAPKAA